MRNSIIKGEIRSLFLIATENENTDHHQHNQHYVEAIKQESEQYMQYLQATLR